MLKKTDGLAWGIERACGSAQEPREAISPLRNYVSTASYGAKGASWLTACQPIFGQGMSDQGRQSARIKAEEYYSRFELETETLLYYLRANGDIVITGPEDSAFKHNVPDDHRRHPQQCRIRHGGLFSPAA